MIVDDHEVVRILAFAPCSNMSQTSKWLEKPGSAEEALVKVANCKPDVHDLDIQLPGRRRA